MAEEVLIKEYKFLKNVLENMSDAFISLDFNWRYTYMNSKAGVVLGNPTEMIGKNIWEEFPEFVGHLCIKL
jgi:PAS domain-containing protein